MQIRLLYIINSFARAGAEKLVYDLSQKVLNECEKVCIAALYESEDNTGDEMQRELESKGIKTYVLKKRAGKDRMRSILAVRRILKDEKINVIHAHCSVPMLIGKMAGKISHVPVICTVHSTAGYSAKREKLTSSMTERYVSIGQAAEDYMTQKLNISKDKITRIYNAVDTKAFKKQEREADFWSEWGIQSGAEVILCVGRVTDVKNQICLLRAIKRCKDAGYEKTAVILGRYKEDDPVYCELKKYAEDNNIENNVKFLGVQNNVSRFLSNADCYVMTSKLEGMSVAFLEAVLCKAPVVVTDMAFARELNDIAPCSTIVPQNDDEALSKVLINKNYFAPSNETVDKFRFIFSMDKFASEHISLYKSVIDK